MYPTIEQVNAATHFELCGWYRFLPSPGASAINKGRPAFDVALAEQKVVLDRIVERMKEMGGMTPAISKQLGW